MRAAAVVWGDSYRRKEIEELLLAFVCEKQRVKDEAKERYSRAITTLLRLSKTSVALVSEVNPRAPLSKFRSLNISG